MEAFEPKPFVVEGRVKYQVIREKWDEFLYTKKQNLIGIYVKMDENDNRYPYPDLPSLLNKFEGKFDEPWLESFPAKKYIYCLEDDHDEIKRILINNGLDGDLFRYDCRDRNDDKYNLNFRITEETYNKINEGFIQLINEKSNVIKINWIDVPFIDVDENTGELFEIKKIKLNGPYRADAYILNDENTLKKPKIPHPFENIWINKAESFSSLLYSNKWHIIINQSTTRIP